MCSGSCGSVFHPGCVGLNATNFKAWTANVGLLWFCEICRINFNPSVIDREAVIIKTMRDLLLRVDSMDLRIGQFGEHLKKLNNLLPMTEPMRRESNFSSRLQRFIQSGPIEHDHTDFYNSIDRLNLDSTLRSNATNNSVIFPEDHDVALDDSKSNDRTEPSGNLPRTYAAAVAAPVVPSVLENVNASRIFPAVKPSTATNSATNATFSTANTTVTAITTTAAAAAVSTTAAPRNAVSNPVVQAAAGTSFSTGSTRTSRPNDVVQENCRLKVVNRRRLPSNREVSDEQLKSFYVTPFTVEQTEEDIIEYLRETVTINDSTVKCVKLVPRNKNINELSFISFKVSVSEDLASVIGDRFYWPDGVEIREFQPKNGVRINQTVPM